MRAVRGSLFGLHVLVGAGALAGGFAAIRDPLAPLGMPAEALANSPFHTFLIPGLILFVIVGLGNLAAAACFLLKRPWQGYVSGTAAGALVVWILVQCAMLKSVVFLHVLFFLFGGIMGLLSLALLARENLWPGTWAGRAAQAVFGGKPRA